MHKQRAEPSLPAQLRMKAEEQLFEGTAPATLGWPTGEPALALLHRLAHTPASASDALKLLHELQVHQVELDLQQEEVAHAHQHLSQEHERYFAMFDLAPLGYLTVDAKGRVVEANDMAAAWIGWTKDTPRPAITCFEDLLSPAYRQAFHHLLQRLREGSKMEAITAHTQSNGHVLFLRAAPAPGGLLYLVAFMPLSAWPEH